MWKGGSITVLWKLGRPEIGSLSQIQMQWISHRSSKNKVHSKTLYTSLSRTHSLTHTFLGIYRLLSAYFNIYVPHTKKIIQKAVNNVIKSPHTTSYEYKVTRIYTLSTYFNVMSFLFVWSMSSASFLSIILWVFHFWQTPLAPLHQLAQDQQSQNKDVFLHHSQGNPVRCHWLCLDRDPQVFGVCRTLFLLCFRPCGCHGVAAAAAATAAVVMATAAAVAAHH